MSTLKGFFQITRPVNTILCAFSVICGGIIGGKPLDHLSELIEGIRHADMPPWTPRLAFAAISASLILASGNVFNDVCDLSCDRINAPDRPIPSGRVTAGAAVIFALLLAFIGIWLSAPLGTPGVTIALSASVVLFAYDMKLKGIPFVGNLSVASLGGLAFVYGGVAGESVTRSLLPAVFAILFHFGRELIKDSADIKGDNAVGIKTAATVWGVRPTCRLAAIALGILAIITAVPFVAGYFGLIYLTIIILGVWPALIFSIKVSLADTSQKRLYAASLALKFAMPAGIIAVLAGFQGL